ncbi:MAG: RagB/SusD family nutrient uptake outer membrane protein [Rikenellaceae bacterium]
MIKNINKLLIGFGLFTSVITLSSCEDFLSKTPLDQVTVDDFFTTEADLAAFSLKNYSFTAPGTSSYDLPGLTTDANTDNVVLGGSGSTALWLPYTAKTTSTSTTYSFSTIRQCNYFLYYVPLRIEEGRLAETANVNYYIGEVYFLRALQYYSKLQSYGDFPIVTEVLPDDMETLVAASERKPRNEVARFILEDLDEAISRLQDNFSSKNRISKNVAQLLKSRVALYEASWLTYHKGTAFVPGGTGWPGASMSYNSDFSIDIDSEISFFLSECMAAAKEVADGISLTANSGVYEPKASNDGGSIDGWNSYFDMFVAEDMSGISEVLMWKDYDRDLNVLAAGQDRMCIGSAYGLTKSAIDTYLMENGLPWYDAASGYQGDTDLDIVKEDRDGRLKLFVYGHSSLRGIEGYSGNGFVFGYPTFTQTNAGNIDPTGYRNRKYYTYDTTKGAAGNGGATFSDAGWIIYRGVEALLNYMEASCMANGGTSIDGTAATYWAQIRQRAGVSTDYAATVAATDLSKEDDWAVYSAGVQIPEMLYNIRRERRLELMCEGFRWSDLKRWRALDQINDANKYVVEGCNLWEKMYDEGVAAYAVYNAAYVAADNGANYSEDFNSFIVEGFNPALLDWSATVTANISSPDLGNYVRPYQKTTVNNDMYDGYSWGIPYYLQPLPADEIAMTCSTYDDGSFDYDSAILYQNPYWPSIADATYDSTWE